MLFCYRLELFLQANHHYSTSFTFNYETQQFVAYVNTIETINTTLPSVLSNSAAPMSIGRIGGVYNSNYFKGSNRWGMAKVAEQRYNISNEIAIISKTRWYKPINIYHC